MEIKEQVQINNLFRTLWDNFYPNRDTHPDDIPRVVTNKEWLRDSLLFYGWKANKQDMISISIKFVDSGAILYCDEMPCALLSVNQLGAEPTLRITYVDNRAQ